MSEKLCEKRYELTQSQLGIYLECADPGRHADYLVPLRLTFDIKAIDENKLAAAFDRVAASFSAFRTVINTENGVPYMSLYEGELPHIQINYVSEEEAAENLNKLQKPFAFDGSLLWRAGIYVSADRIMLDLCIHHSIFDGTSISVFNRALAGACDGAEISETNTLFDAKCEENELFASEKSREAEKFFDTYLDGDDCDSNIIPDRTAGEYTFDNAFYTVPYSDSALEAFAESKGVTVNHIFLAAFSYTLAKFNGQKETLFSTVESGRFGGNYANSMGMFVKTFPLKFTIDESLDSAAYVKYVKQNYFSALTHNKLAFSSLAEKHPGLADIKYVYQGNIFTPCAVGGSIPELNTLDASKAASNLETMVYRNCGKHFIRLGYRSDMYTREMMDCFADLWCTVLGEILAGKQLSSFVLTSQKSDSIQRENNATAVPLDKNATVGRLFDKICEKYPDNTAVVYRDRRISYRELSSLTNRLAARLVSRGIGKDDAVPVLIPRNEYMPVCAMGIVKAGAAYEPLDPAYPAERLEFMVKDCEAKLLIADRSLRGLLPDFKGEVLYTDEIDTLPECGSCSCDEPDGAFVLIYTSGTTGTPKGCILENRNAVAFCNTHIRNAGLSEKARIATIASFGFDAAVMENFPSLLSGASIYIIPDEIKLDIPAVEKFYTDNRITNGFMTTQLARMFLLQTKCPTLRFFLFGGEKLVPFNPPATVKCINAYGPSETLVYVCSYEVKDGGTFQPIGRPQANTRFYVRDEGGRLLPAGCSGELCVSGLQVGRGYRNRPEKTAEAFISNPYDSDEGYERLYRTGDTVRLLPDGNIDFIGRRDGQVKIRGFRVELTEIEQVVREYPGIKNATVQAYDDGNTGKFVACFVVFDEKVDIDSLNAFIAERKPPYMVPAVTVQTDNIPVNANGKVDKRKLPKPERKFENIVMPRTDAEKTVFDAVSELVGSREFGIDTDLYLAGLSSISSIKLCSVLADKFGRTVQMNDIRRNSTVRKLSALLEEEKQQKSPGTGIKLPDYPLTKNQEGIFAECLSKPGSTSYNIPLLLKISSEIDIDRLKAAIVTAVEAHPYIKTVLFTGKDGSIRQKNCEAEPFTAEDIETLDGTADIKPEPFELTGSRLFRFRIYRGAETYLFAELHHIIADGTSINVFVGDIEKAYRGEKPEKESFSSFDIAMDEQLRSSTSLLSDAKAYYDRLLDGLDMNFLPGADRLPSKEKSSGKLVLEQKDSDFAELSDYCDRHRISPNGLLCSVFGFVLAKYAGTDYSVFNTVYNGRSDSRAAGTFGMLVKTLPVVCRIDREQPADIAKDISMQLIGSMSNDLYPFSEICREYGVKNDIIFVYQGDSFSFDSFCGKESGEIPLDLSESKVPLSVEVRVENGRLRYICEYRAELFTQELIDTFLQAYSKAISEFIKETPVPRISLVTAEVLEKMNGYNATESGYDTSLTIPVMFMREAQKHPDTLCVSYKEKSYTYAEAFDLSLRVGMYLKQQGTVGGDRIAILIERDESMVICAHGVLMSGAAYVGLDPTYPPERLAFMISDSGSRLVICDRKLRELIKDYTGKILFTDEIPALPAGDELVQTFADIRPEDPCLIVYSSGTTGVPKGSVLTHGNIVCFCHNYSIDTQLGDGAHVAMYASFGFDGGAMDVLCDPMTGTALHVVPSDIRMDLEKMEQFYTANGITHGFMTTQVGTMFVSSTHCRTLRTFMVGGEKFIPVLPGEGITLYNGYGPSETMCYVNLYVPSDLGGLQPIGRANRNIKEYIIDKYGNRLPFGACGELCIAGGQTGAGYLNRPEKTASSFVPNPFCEIKPYDRMYRTGDIVRELPDGNYVFEGRRDGQVKIRGFRVELSEIEQVIREYEGIKTATVQAFDAVAGGKYIAAYIVADSEIDIEALNAFIAARKPDYMVPAVTMQIEAIPLTSNGKVDKKKLPEPGKKAQKKGLEPENETEEAICNIFGEVLGLSKVYADDDFFAIGGSSISAIKVVVKCNNAGYDIVFKNLFANPTPRALSGFIESGRGQSAIPAAAAAEENKDKKETVTGLKAMAYNRLEYVDEICRGDIGDVFLTGATGFLGSHILKELLDNTAAKVLCLVRGKDGMDGETRLNMMMTYYFEDWFDKEKAKRVTVIDGELEDSAVAESIKKAHFDTVINSAAVVKHFAAGDEMLRSNVSGVENLIKLAEQTGALLVQISSLSVSGEAAGTDIPEDYLFRECDLDIGQSLENRYVYSKHMAERAVLEAVSAGKIRGKIIRLGNLMARYNDSEFQVNAGTSAFLKQFTAYRKLRMFPVGMMDKKIEFSPIDTVAKAVVLLSGTPDKFTVFHARNCNAIHYGYFISAMNREGLDVSVVSDSVFAEAYRRALESEDGVEDFSTLIAYKDNGGRGQTHQIDSDDSFTVKALYRLGFAWPLISDAYLEKMVKTLIELGFFS